MGLLDALLGNASEIDKTGVRVNLSLIVSSVCFLRQLWAYSRSNYQSCPMTAIDTFEPDSSSSLAQ
jgi:hypothetical protein